MLTRRSLLRAMAVSPLALSGLPTLTAAQTTSPTPRITPALIQQVQTLAQQGLSAFDIVGAALALIQDGEVVYASGFGVRDLETGEPFDPNTVHRIGSTTKSMTSMLAAIQVEQGLFAFDTPVREITDIFRFPEAQLTDSVTVRQLMGMDTGLGETPIELYLDLESPRHFLNKSLPTLPVLYPPFTHFFYNDWVYACAGYVGLLKQGTQAGDLENAYARLMQSELFDPIGMPTSAITDDPSNLSNNVSRSYGYDLRLSQLPSYRVPYQPVRMVSPAGATATTINEMARYLITQLNGGVTPDGNRIVAGNILAETTKGQTPIPGAVPAEYAMGWVDLVDPLVPPNGLPYIYHTGSVDAFKTDMAMIPEANVGILVFANTETAYPFFNTTMRRAIIALLYNVSPQPIIDTAMTNYANEKAKIQAIVNSVTGYSVPRRKVAPFLGDYAKGWRVEYADGLPIMTRKAGASLVLLPTVDQYVIASGTEAGGFGDRVQFVMGNAGRPHLVISDASGTVDDLPRLD
jgi:CubicO group peptidase (beta-lactamase class C family)